MPTVLLSLLTNHPRSGTGDRRLAYTHRRSWTLSLTYTLTVTLPVTYHFIGEEGTWSPARMGAFRRAFSIDGARAWSGRHRLVRDTVVGELRTDVEVRIVEEPAPNNRLAHVVVMPPEVDECPTRTFYTYTGQFPPNYSNPTLMEEEFHQNVGGVVLRETDVGCDYTHLHRGPNGEPAPPQIPKLTHQSGMVHEIGHLLGMQHPLAPNNEHSSYGNPMDPNEGGRVMGLGSAITRSDYHWAVQLTNYATMAVWRVTRGRDWNSGLCTGG